MGDDHGNAEAVVGRALIEMASMGLPEPLAVGHAAEERDRCVDEIIERKDERRRQMARTRKLQQEPAEQKSNGQTANVAEKEACHWLVEGRKSEDSAKQR